MREGPSKRWIFTQFRVISRKLLKLTINDLAFTSSVKIHLISHLISTRLIGLLHILWFISHLSSSFSFLIISYLSFHYRFLSIVRKTVTYAKICIVTNFTEYWLLTVHVAWLTPMMALGVSSRILKQKRNRLIYHYMF